MMKVPLSKLKPAEWNPRLIKDERFKNLCKSIENDPEFMKLRPILATKDGTIYAGNMRYRAVQHLGWTEVDAELTDIPEKLAKERAIKDNNQFGEWDDNLATFLDELEKEGIDLDQLGLDEPVAQILDSFDLPDGDKPPFQQMTFTLHDDQVEQVNNAIKVAKGMGEFNSPNENSNGNALARICDTFLTNHGKS
tara:strand:+ start:39 stop:620 length:582 start_codon:yes stop_codon:yes gene_type:complete